LVVSNVLIRQEQARTRDERDRTEKAHRLAEERGDEIQKGLEGLKAANALVDKARFYTEQLRWDDAAAAYTKAIELRPEHAPAWEQRGELYASLGLWELAAADLTRAAKLKEPATGSRWLILALARAYVGDLPGYRAVCVRMGERLQGTTVHHFTMDLVRTNAWIPGSPLGPARQVELAEAIVAVKPRVYWFLHALGIAHYRAGQYEPAIQRLKESVELEANWSGMNYPFLAMAYHRLGRHDEARRALDEAEQALNRWAQARYESGRDYWAITKGATAYWPIWCWDWMACQMFYREARSVLGLPPPPDDPRLHVLRARAFAGLGWPDKAAAEFAQALKLSPQDEQVRVEAHRNQAFYHIARGQWQQAAAEYGQARALLPEDPRLWWCQAVTHLAADDRKAYRQICVATLERFGATQDPREAYIVVSACMVLPDALPDMARLVPVGRVAAGWYPGSGRRLAAALCRAGAHDEAARCFQEAATHFRFRAEDWLFLAMAHHRRGHAAEAQHCLTKATQWINEADHAQVYDTAETQPAWGDWHERIVIPLLRQEVEGLLKQ
jgi:tetratricopeptide (TPR) repeat protein